MKKILTSAGALAALAVTTPADASNTAQANASVNIVSPLSLTKNTDLNFGTVVGPFASQVVHVDTTGARNCGGLTCSGTFGAATFTVTGTPSQDVTLTIPASVTLNGPGGSLNVDMSTDKPADPTLSAAGSASFGVGGKLTIPSGTADGVYSNTFNVTANYK
ncbi:MAG: DUF4402 domain-containing protein [Sphingomonas sp.]